MEIEFLTLIDDASGDGIDITIIIDKGMVINKHIEHITREDYA